MENQNKIKVDTGRKQYVIEDLFGNELGTFLFNPADLDIVWRYNETLPEIEKAMTQDVEDGIEALSALEDILKQKIDYIFAADISNTFFAVSGPLTPLAGGELFVEHVVNVLAALIEKELNVRVKKMEKNIKKYTDKYNKGKEQTN